MTRTRPSKPTIRCTFKPSCYLASELKCFGYKIDCILYRASNGEPMDDARFDRAMDELIGNIRKKHTTKASP